MPSAMPFVRTPHSSGPACAPGTDFVIRDHAALALHMAHCARTRGRLFEFRRRVQDGQVLLASRLVTVAFVGSLALTVLAYAVS